MEQRKVCTCCKQEKDIDEFSAIPNGLRRQSQCKKCLYEKKKREKKKHVPMRKVEKTDSKIANDLTKMPW